MCYYMEFHAPKGCQTLPSRAKESFNQSIIRTGFYPHGGCPCLERKIEVVFKACNGTCSKCRDMKDTCDLVNQQLHRPGPTNKGLVNKLEQHFGEIKTAEYKAKTRA